MIDFHSILKKNLYGVFATTANGKPQTRIFQYLFSVDDKVYFGTTNDKPTYRQLIENPYISFCSHTPDYMNVLSINGKINFVDDLSLKTRAMEEYPAIKELYKFPENPIFEIFYVDIETVKAFDFEHGAKEYTLSN